MRDPYFFGYGSLVNTATHGYTDPRPARLVGWRRVWRQTAPRPVAFLSARPSKYSTIDGLIAAVPGADWEALDQREWAYRRHDITGAVDHDLPQRPEISVYSVPADSEAPPDVRHPVLLSYLDVVVQGYLRVFGTAGAKAFFATTDGWDAPVLNDRAAPRYPRAQSLSVAETAFVDAELARLGVVFTDGE